jgi:CheY-like chemotaxis protein
MLAVHAGLTLPGHRTGVNTNSHWLTTSYVIAMTKDAANQQPRVCAVVNDLMFASKIRAAADQLAIPIAFARTSAALHEHAATASLLLLDLNTRWLNPASEIRALKANPATQHLRIIAFGSHTDSATLTAAREAGADRVMANSAFVGALQGLLNGV